MDGDLWPSDKAGRAWGNASGRLAQRVYRYSSPGLARLEFARSDPAVVYCDPGECDGTRSVALRAPAPSDAYKAVCIKGDDYCTNYVYVGRFGQYIVEVQYNAGLSGPVLTDEGFSVVAAHFEDVVAFKIRS